MKYTSPNLRSQLVEVSLMFLRYKTYLLMTLQLLLDPSTSPSFQSKIDTLLVRDEIPLFTNISNICAVLFIDLLKNYKILLPPTIAKKKRESERKVPIRKRTAPIDMRLSRSRISVGADAQQLFAAQQAAQNPSLTKGPKSPPLPPPPPQVLQGVAQPIPPPPPPPEVVQKFKAPPPPPALEKPKTPPPPPPAPRPSSVSNLPPRPQFKEPPPEDDDLPPRPSFKNPPPETGDAAARPKFVDPPPEEEEEEEEESEEEESEEEEEEEEEESEEEEEKPAKAPSPPPRKPSPKIPPPPPPAAAVIPQKRLSATFPSRNSPTPSQSPPPPPPNEDVVLGTGKATITRSGSGQNPGAGIRGPRLARGAPRGGNVQNLVSSINRSSISGSPSPQTPSSPKINRLSGSPVRRPSSIVGRSAAVFSRRTMASDAEDDVVDK